MGFVLGVCFAVDFGDFVIFRFIKCLGQSQVLRGPFKSSLRGGFIPAVHKLYLRSPVEPLILVSIQRGHSPFLAGGGRMSPEGGASGALRTRS
jgi:hypothetical protein